MLPWCAAEQSNYASYLLEDTLCDVACCLRVRAALVSEAS